MDWLDLLAIQETLKSLLQHHSSKASILWHSAFVIVQLSHPHMTTGKTIDLTRQTFVGPLLTYIKKQERFQIKSLTLYLKKPEKRRTNEPKVGRRIEMIRAAINEIDNRRNKQTNKNPIKSWFFEKVSKFNKSLATPSKEKKRKNPNQQNYT